MITEFDPLENDRLFDIFTDAMHRMVNHPDAVKFISYNLRTMSLEQIKELTRSYKDYGLKYFVNQEDNGSITGIATIRYEMFEDPDFFILMIDERYRYRGIAKNLTAHIVNYIKSENHKSMAASVYADNKNMLRLIIQFDFLPVNISHRRRSDGADLVHFRRYFK